MKAVQGSRMVSRDLHRQVDTQGFVFAEREALSTRAVKLPTSEASPSGCLRELFAISILYRINRQARDEVEGHCGRVFLDAPGKDAHRSTQRYVPLGKTIPQGRDCGRVSFASAPGAMSETWDLSLCFRGFERKTIEKGEES